MILKDPVHIGWKISPIVLQYHMRIYPILYFWEMKIQIIHMCQEPLRHLADWFHLLFWTNTSTHLELAVLNIIATLILWSSYSFRYLEHRAIIFNLIPVRKVPYQNVYLKQYIHSAYSSRDVDALKFRLIQYDTFYGCQIQQDSLECLMILIEVINKGSVSYCGFKDNDYLKS